MMQMQGMAAWWMNKKMENRRVFYLQGYEKFMRKLTPPVDSHLTFFPFQKYPSEC